MKYNENSWRVELHVHLSGSFRPSRILELAKIRGIQLPSSNSVAEFTDFCRMKEPGSLADFLKNFPVWTSVVVGDKDAIRQTAYDFVEDCACQKIAYVETRFGPMFLAKGDVTVDDVIEAALDGIREAEEKFGTKCNLIVSLSRDRPELSRQTFDAAKRFYGKGVVGIDIAGNELLNDGVIDGETVKIFQEAEKLGINRTVHAGENGSAKCVQIAVHDLKAQRIGHGYRVLQDETIYQAMRSLDIHFETCPTSSVLTGGASADWNVHPIRRFHKDKINYSLNTDDPLITGKTLSQEYDLCHEKLGLDAGEIERCNFNAAKSSFLNCEEKEELLNHMRKVLNADAQLI